MKIAARYGIFEDPSYQATIKELGGDLKQIEKRVDVTRKSEQSEPLSRKMRDQLRIR